MRYRLVIKEAPGAYLTIGRYGSMAEANRVADHFPNAAEPTIYTDEITLGDFVELIMLREDCDAETAIYEAVLEHKLACGDEVIECFGEYGLIWDKEASERLYK